MIHRILSIASVIYPVNYANQLFLVLSMEKEMQKVKTKIIRDHFMMLKNRINEDCLLIQFQNKNILVRKGLAGINFILMLFNNPENKNWQSKFPVNVINSITASEFWGSVANKKKLNGSNLGILSGLAGVGMALIHNTIQNEA